MGGWGGRSAWHGGLDSDGNCGGIYTLSHLIDCPVDDLFLSGGGGEGGVLRHAKEIRPRHFLGDVIAGEGLLSPSPSLFSLPSFGQTALWQDIMGVSFPEPDLG